MSYAGGSVGFRDNQALNAVSPPQRGETAHFLIDPPRARAVGRADDDQAVGALERFTHRLGEVGRGSEFGAILEYRGQPTPERTDRTDAPDQRCGKTIPLKLAVEPGGPRTVAVIIADERRVAPDRAIGGAIRRRSHPAATAPTADASPRRLP